MKIKISIIPLSLTLISWLLMSSSAFCASVPPEPKKGGRIPIISFPVPKTTDEKIYLGLSEEGSFKIQQIKAKVVLIKIFNLYCPICQSTSSAMVELYHQIKNHPDFSGKIKLIGIGAGNSQSEIEVFKQNNKIPFPIFPDQDFRIHKALGGMRIPFFITLKMNRNRSHEVVHTHLGGLTDVVGLLDVMYEAFGISREDLQRKEKLATSAASKTSFEDELD